MKIEIDNDFRGKAYIIQNDEVLLDYSGGYADLANEIHNTFETNVKQLLNHTSGVPDYFDESVMDDYEALWTDYTNYRIRHNEDICWFKSGQ